MTHWRGVIFLFSSNMVKIGPRVFEKPTFLVKNFFSGISDIGGSANTSRLGNLDDSWFNVKNRLSVA